MLSPVSGFALGLFVWTLPAACATASAIGDPETASTAAQAATLFLRAKRVIVQPGEVLEDVAVIVRDGRIVAVGKDLQRPEGARELEAKVLCAAYVDAWGALGLAGSELFDTTSSAATRTVDAYDPYIDEPLRNETLRAGVTCVRVQSGSSARVGGVGALVRVAPGLARGEAAIVDEAGVAMSVGLSANVQGQGPTFEIVDGQIVQRESSARGMDPFDRQAEVDRVVAAVESGRGYLQSKIEQKHELEDWQKKVTEKETELEKDFKKAKKDREKEEKDAKEKNKKFEEKKYKEDKRPQPPKFDDDAEVLGRVANGELPLVVQAHRTAELRALLGGVEKYDRLRLVLEGASEALNCVEQLSARHVPVIVTPALVGRGAADELEGADLSLAARLSLAGVPVLIGSGGSTPAASRDLPLLAEVAIGNGLERQKAFEALTLGAARAFDAADRIGSVERGKDAELLLLDGDPLTPQGRVLYVISAGRVVVTPESR